MRILHLLKSSSYSGAENVACRIIGMFEEGNTLAYASPDGDIAAALDARGVTFLPMRAPTFREAARVIREFRPDIIHAHDMGASLWAAVTCKSTPLILHIHNNGYASRGISVKSLAFLPAAVKARHIFWVSKSARDGYRFIKPFYKKSSVLQNVADARSMTSGDAPHYDLLYVGRLTYPKHPERLLDIIALIKKELPDLSVAFAGTGELFDNVRQKCASLGLSDNVDFLGFVDDPLALMKNAGVMLMCSRWEGTPICVLEAQALGLPLVSTPADGIADIIENGKNGFLETEDAGLARRAVQILKDGALRRKMSACATARSRELGDSESYRRKIEAQYKRCL